MQKEGPTRLVDVAFCYIDGGANGWDREENHARRMALNVDDLTTVAFETWWGNHH
tara:strand:+ start:192 stop:356 length:165 start_codon:yes stop_codon:yes gene_type:complete